MASLRVLLVVLLVGLALTRMDFFGLVQVDRALEPGPPAAENSSYERLDAGRSGSEIIRPDFVVRETRPAPEHRVAAEKTDQFSAASERLTLSGRVGTEFGVGVASEPVILYSPSKKLRYTTTTGDSGVYRFIDIEPGWDYVLNVSPRGPFENFTRSQIKLSFDQEVQDVVLKAIALGVLSGNIVDPYERPVAGIELLVTAVEKEYRTISVVTDANGGFRVADFPKGKFQLAIKGEQALKATGLEFDPAANLPVKLTVDLGPYQIEGGIYDQSGQNFDGADVYLNWVLHENGVSIRSTRRVSADSSGAFRFSGLGPGRHELVVSAWRGGAVKKAVSRTVDVGVDSGELLVVIDTY